MGSQKAAVILLVTCAEDTVIRLQQQLLVSSSSAAASYTLTCCQNSLFNLLRLTSIYFIMASTDLSSNHAVRMLKAAEEGKYGVLGVVAYNMETVVACIRAAENKSSPLQILLFPWALKYSPLLVDFCAAAARKAKVPVTLHLDHAQDATVIKTAAEMKAVDGTPAFDSIMVDMSHFEKEENLARTKELVAFCHESGIATEAEPGRIEGGEDGVQDKIGRAHV